MSGRAGKHHDPIDHPSHYMTAAGIEAIDVIEQYGLGMHLGNAMKYLLRAGRKGDAATDLGKARWYLARWIDGVLRRYGIEMPIAASTPGKGWHWCCPGEVAKAFALEGPRREAVILILDAAVIGDGDREIVGRIARARENVEAAIGLLARAGALPPSEGAGKRAPGAPSAPEGAGKNAPRGDGRASEPSA